MLNRFKNKLANIVGGISSPNKDGDGSSGHTLPNDVSPFPYARPQFLQLSPDEVQVSADHVSRPILVPRNTNVLPWNAGYAEVINAGKTKVNEDQARTEIWTMPKRNVTGGKDSASPPQSKQSSDGIPIHYFAVFDGHAGTGASLMAVNILHLIVQDKLLEVQKLLEAHLFGSLPNIQATDIPTPESPPPQSPATPPFSPPPELSQPEYKEIKQTTDSHQTTESKDTENSSESNQTKNETENEKSEDPDAKCPDSSNSDISMPDTKGESQSMETSTPVENGDIINGSSGAPQPEAPSANSQQLTSPTQGRSGFSLSLDKFSVENLVIGALEASFFDMDGVIARERRVYCVPGGCTAVVAVFFMGKLYVANAGDSRAVICSNNQVTPMSNDFTPETDRQRIQLMAWHHPELLCNIFSPVQFAHRVTKKDIGKRVLHRDGWRKGWSYKTVTEEDVMMPLIYGEGKKARLLGTIGVSRGFGDHDLRVYESEVYVKPFMSCAPEVLVYDLTNQAHTENDVIILGTDGLWDVTPNEKAASIVQTCLAQFSPDDPSRYVSAAQELVMHARGVLKGGWKTSEDRLASGDDITVFVIPLHRHSTSLSQSNSTESST